MDTSHMNTSGRRERTDGDVADERRLRRVELGAVLRPALPLAGQPADEVRGLLHLVARLLGACA